MNKKIILTTIMILMLSTIASAISYYNSYSYQLVNTTGGAVNPRCTINASSNQYNLQNCYINASYILDAPWVTVAESDTNNYTTSLSFNPSTKVLTLGRNGMTSLTSFLGYNTSIACNDADSYLYNVSLVNGALTGICATDTAGSGSTPDYGLTLDAQYNLTNKAGLANSHTLACQNITGSSSNLCTIVDTDTNTGTTNAHLHSALNITGTLSDGQLANASSFARLSGFSGENITSGTVADARIASTIARDTEVTTAVSTKASLAGIDGSNITTGTIADARIASTLTRDSEVPSLETDAAHDTCSEISGCVVGAITDGNTNWDNTYGFITSTQGNATYVEREHTTACSSGSYSRANSSGGFECFADQVGEAGAGVSYSILLDAEFNLTNKEGLENTHMLSCSNITGASSDLCTLVNTDTDTNTWWGRNDTDIINQSNTLAFNWTTLNTALNLRMLLTDFQTQNTSLQSAINSKESITNVATIATNLQANITAQKDRVDNLNSTKLNISGGNIDGVLTIGGGFDIADGTTINGGHGWFGGNLYVGGNLTSLYINTQVANGSLIPFLDNTFNIGNSTHAWKDAYIDGTLTLAGVNVGTTLAGKLDTATASTTYVARNTWTSIDSYPTACTGVQVVSGLGDTLACVTPYYHTASWTNTTTTVSTTLNVYTTGNYTFPDRGGLYRNGTCTFLRHNSTYASIIGVGPGC